jgi:hypothetical protein
VSFLAEEIAKDPTSTIAVAHEMARKNGTTPGAFNPTFVGLALLAALGMVAVDARHKPVLASVAYSITVFVTVSATLARMPAFAQSLASVPQTALAATVTVLAGVTGGGGSRAGGGGAATARSRNGLESSYFLGWRVWGCRASAGGSAPCAGLCEVRSPGALGYYRWKLDVIFGG